jgi:nitrogen fixation/metabolism regulation signal transduction histidine kinase
VLRSPGKTETRLALVILTVTTAPLLVAVLLARSMFSQASAIWFNPEVGRELDRGVELYKDYVKAVKDDMRHQTDALAADEPLREAARKKNVAHLSKELDALFPHYPELVSLRVTDTSGHVLATRDRGRPVDETTERSLEVARPLGADPDPATLVATFAADRKKLDSLESASGVVARYHQLESSRSELDSGYVAAFAALLGITSIMTVGLGIFLARGVTRRITRLGAAMNLAAQGDLTARVPITGSDELTELAAGFNRMLEEISQTRARLEFMQKVGAWQEMAQRLAHEIKNPLTPIQLAVQECHRKYPGDDRKFRELLDATLEIVEEEVGTLRRLVSNFSNFARLPHAELRDGSLRDFVKECAGQLAHLEDEGGSVDQDAASTNVTIEWSVPDAPLPVAIDKQMLRRVIVNLVRNAVQAIRGARGEGGHVCVSAAAEGMGAVLFIDDDGPGVSGDVAARVFEPYYTTKAEGTGLGLAIVKKIIVEHGGAIDVAKSSLGGARFSVHLPPPTSTALQAAREARELALRMGVSTSQLEIPEIAALREARAKESARDDR